MNLPPHPSRHRVAIWRRLRRLGAVTLGTAWILPDRPETLEAFQWVVQQVRSARGRATLARVQRLETMRDAEVAGLFHAALAPDYRRAIADAREILARLDRHGSRPPAGLERWRARLEAARRELDRLRAIDYLASPLGRTAGAVWETAARRLRGLEARPARIRPARRAGRMPPAGSTWVTRPRPHVDRIASAWLIKRFIDSQARFAFADTADTGRRGVPFDVLGAEFGHQGEDCTFETLLARARLTDRRLREIAEIVHEADLHDGKYARGEAAGIDLALRALTEAVDDDHAVLERGLTVFDGLYTLLKGVRKPRRARKPGARRAR